MSQNNSNELEGNSKTNNKWQEWSMEPHTEDEIRDAYINDPDNICTSYICRYSNLSEDFIEELIYLSTGVFSYRPDLYTENNIEYLKKIMSIEPTSARTNYIKSINMKNVSNKDKEFVAYLKTYHSNIRSKIDWWQIASYQKLSKDFRNKFAVKFNEAKIKSQNEFV